LKRAVRDQDLEPYADFASDDDRLVQRMAADRFAGVLPDSVSETDLMRRYGVARGALARVLNGLVQDNVIERRSGNGWRFLPAVNATQLHEDSYRFRLLIEPACVLEPTFRLDKARAQRLRQTHVALLADGLEKLSSIKFFELNAEFHEFIAGCSRNRFLEQAVINQNRLRRFFNYIAVFGTERMRVSCSEHVAILDRLIAGEREHAVAADAAATVVGLERGVEDLRLELDDLVPPAAVRDPELQRRVKAEYPAFRARCNAQFAAINTDASNVSALEVGPEERRRVYDERWARGGLPFTGAFADLRLSAEANATAADYVRGKIREIVKDPEVARKLSPHSTIGCKRICVDTAYYPTFNRSNVTLVDLTDAVCPTEACSVVQNGIIKFRDNNHLTATFARSLAPALEAALAPVL